MEKISLGSVKVLVELTLTWKSKNKRVAAYLPHITEIFYENGERC